MIDTLELREFTAFKKLKIDFSSKINVIIGANGTGKSQLLKATHAMCVGDSKIQSGSSLRKDDVEADLSRHLTRLFMPLDNKLGRMRKHGAGRDQAIVKAGYASGQELELSFTPQSKNIQLESIEYFKQKRPEPVFFPTKEVLSFMLGFVSLYEHRELSFDQTYQDICILLDLPPMRQEKLSERARWAMDELEAVCGGRFIFYGGGKVTFKFTGDDTEYSANAIAEGFRKAGMLSRLLETGTIRPGESGPLIWDEPEANLNPAPMELMVQILLDLSRNGQQIILATHDYVMLKWFDLLKQSGDHIRFHSLYRDETTSEIQIASTDEFQDISPNQIDMAFGKLLDQEIENDMGDLGK